MNRLRALPAVDSLLQSEAAQSLIDEYGRPLVVESLRQTLENARQMLREGGEAPSETRLLQKAQTALSGWLAPTLQPVINATGVIIHTNLGRAPLSQGARQAMLDVAGGYSSLEYDLETGRRGSRMIHAEALLCRLCQAESALVVNNNAAAVLLALTALATGREVVISRSQLVEIGGGFRIPDVMRQSGARLVEVGTTNRTHLRDYEKALNDQSALILRVHHSNFKIIGFTVEPSNTELAALGARHALPLLEDLGSGTLLDTAAYGLPHEPTVQESLQAGADLVTFSGDKLLGGPQAGLIVGRKDLVDLLKSHPLARALRADKLCLAALNATLDAYARQRAPQEIPVWRMIAAQPEALKARVETWQARLEVGQVLPGLATVGGGSLPEETLPTWLLSLSSARPDELAQALRRADPPLITRIEDDNVLLDARTVLPEQDDAVIGVLRLVLEKGDARLKGVPR